MRVTPADVVARFSAAKPKPLKTFTNEDTQMESYVYENERSGYNVTVKDLDSGEMLPTSFSGIRDLNQAIQKAKKAVAVS
jgi:hypothetical protein